MLLVTAGLLLRGLSHAESADPGFTLDHATTMSFDLKAEGYTADGKLAASVAQEGLIRLRGESSS